MTQEFKMGDVNPYIFKIQRIISELMQIKLLLDGSFGPMMRDAILSCQTKYNLKPTGTYSPGLAAICDPMIDKKYLNQDSFEKAANLLQLPVPVVKAVQKVESSGYGFLIDGRATILFERHIFRKYLISSMSKSVITLQKVAEAIGMEFIPNITTISLVDAMMIIKHSDIYNTERGGYLGNEKEYPRLELASTFDPIAAMTSASWGLFQIMGFNYAACGYANVSDYVNDAKASEHNQLNAFANFVKSNNNMHLALERSDWRGFSLLYNGAASDESYSDKIQQAVKSFQGQLN